MRVFHRRKGSGQSSAPGAPSISDASPLLARANSGESYETSDEFLARVVLQADVAPAAEEAEEGNAAGAAEFDPAVGDTGTSRPDIAMLATFLLFIFPAIGGLLFGYDIGATSGALTGLKGVHAGVSWAGSNLTPLQTGLIASGSLYGALVGSAAVLLRGNAIGRRQELALAALLYIGGSVCTYFSNDFASLVLSRGLYGLGIGVAMHVAPIYIAETAPPSVRGALVGAKEAFIVAGILLGYSSSYLLSGVDAGWRIGYAVATPLAGILLAGVALWIPESPRYTLLTAEMDGADVNADARLTAAQDLAKLRGLKSHSGADANDPAWRALASEMRETEAGAQVARANTLSIGEFFSQVLRGEGADSSNGGANIRATRSALKIGLGLMLFQQITGQPSVLYYASDILSSAGFSGGGVAQLVAVGLGLFKLLATASSLPFIDSAGRRPLLLLGVGGLTGALVLLGFAAYSMSSGVTTLVGMPVAYASVGALLLYVASYQISFGPISWLIVGEVFPLASRNAALACATLTNFGSNAVVALVLPAVQSSLGESGTYFLFATFAVAAWLFIQSSVPETKGKTLEEIERELGGEGQ